MCVRNTQECLLLQIDAMERDKSLDLTVPRTLVSDYLHDLGMNRLPQIAKKSGFSIEQINHGKEFLKHLSMHPGRLMQDDKVPSVTPDAIVDKDEETGEYTMRLTEEHAASLHQ